MVKALDAIAANTAVCGPRGAKYLARACIVRAGSRSGMRTLEFVQRDRAIGATARQNFMSCSFPSMELDVCIQPTETARLSDSAATAVRSHRPSVQHSDFWRCDAAHENRRDAENTRRFQDVLCHSDGRLTFIRRTKVHAGIARRRQKQRPQGDGGDTNHDD